jgi:NADPH:quinone reductase-like Zn-dependent oxidoreductase
MPSMNIATRSTSSSLRETNAASFSVAVSISTLTNALERDRLHHTIARRLPLEAIAAAHELLERGGNTIGNVVLDVGE